jgi:hypothetical protein
MENVAEVTPEEKLKSEIEGKKERIYFSLFSGEIYSTFSDEPMDAYQIPLKRRPDPMKNCKKCHGRLHSGYLTLSKHYDPCVKCLKKYADVEQMSKRTI